MNTCMILFLAAALSMVTNTNGTELQYLQDNAILTETLCKDAYGKNIFWDPWQRSGIRDERRTQWYNKTRQGGFSLMISSRALAETHVWPVSDHTFVSKDLEDAKRKIRYVKAFYDTMPERFKLKAEYNSKTEVSFIDQKKRVKTIKAHSSKEPRGMTGNIYLDEVAFYRNAKEIYKAASPARTRSAGKLIAGSSPRGKSGLHYEVCANTGGQYTSIRVYNIYWWLCRGLCVNVQEAAHEALRMETRDRVMKYGTDALKEDFEIFSIDAFRQEYETSFEEGVGAFLTYDQIRECQEPDWGEDPTEAGVSLLCKTNWGEDEAKHDFYEPTEEFWKWVRNNSKGMVEIGYDIARKKHLAAMVITDTFGGLTQVRAIVVLKNKEFDVQEKIINDAIQIVNPIRFGFDHTGMGMSTGERLEKKWGKHRFENIDFTAPMKMKLATNLKDLFTKKQIRIPADTMYENHLHSIEKIVTNANNIILQASDNDDDGSDQHHGDLFWATALACYRGPKDIGPRTYGFGKPKLTSSPRGRLPI
jgi:phage FluMu gp28-like protein